MSSTLSTFLQGLRGEGSLESSGEFSADAEKAAERFRRFVQQEPAYPFLKLVQAAVASKAEHVSVVFTARHVTLSFVPVEQLPFFTGQRTEAPHRIRRYLADALASLLSMRPHDLSWTFRADDHVSGWRWHQGHREELEHGTVREGLTVRLSPTRTARFLDWLRPARQLPTELAHRCAFCPIPVFVNGHSQSDARPEHVLIQDVRDNPSVVCELIGLTEGSEAVFPVLPPPYRGCEELVLHDGTRLGVRGGTSVVTTQWRNGPERSSLFEGECDMEGNLLSGRLPEGSDLILQYRYHQMDARAEKFYLRQWKALGNLQPYLLKGLNTGDGKLAERLSGLQTVRWQQRFSTPVLAATFQLMLLAHPLRPGRLYIVCDGVWLRPTDFDVSVPGLLAVVADHTVETDASGLGVIRNELLQQKLAALQPLAEELVHVARPIFRNSEAAHLNGFNEATQRRLAALYGL